MSLKRLHKVGILAWVMLLANAFYSFSMNDERLLSRNQAQEDIRIYFELIDQQHGNPYQYISRSDFKTLVNSTIEQLPETVSVKEFEILLSQLNKTIRCGHTTVGIDNEFMKSITDRPNFFPYPIRIIDQSIIIDFESSDLPLGAEILSMNGIPAKQMLEEMKTLTVTDGFSETKSLRDIENRFGYYFFLKYGAFTSFDVTYQSPENHLKNTKVVGIAGNEMLANNYYRPVYQQHERYYHFTHLDAIDSLQALVLTLNTFQASPDWFYKKLASRYNDNLEMFDFDNLVIDLRLNEGGDRRLLNILYKFITGEELKDPSKTHIRNRNIIQTKHLVGVNGSHGSDQAIERAEAYLNLHFTEKVKDGYAAKEQNWYETFDSGIAWEGKSFKGQVYVLISGTTFSAAADLARILGDLPNVILVGEETGGANIGRTANMLLNYSLPHTGSMIQVPVIYEEFVNVNTSINYGRGTFPDHWITQTYTDLLAKKDTAFEFTLQLMQSAQVLGSK